MKKKIIFFLHNLKAGGAEKNWEYVDVVIPSKTSDVFASMIVFMSTGFLVE